MRKPFIAPGPLPQPKTGSTEALQEDIQADVCVIGGGLTGISCALALSQGGASVVILEAGSVGSGATGASGGQLVIGTAPDIRRVVGRLGVLTAKFLWDLSIEALWRTKALVARTGPCDLRVGHLLLSESKAQTESLREEIGYWRDKLGYEGVILAVGSETRNFITSPVYEACAFDPNGGHLDPLAFVSNISRLAQQQGVRIFEGSPVLNFDVGMGRVTVRNGSVRSPHIVLAAGAWTGFAAAWAAPLLSSAYGYACHVQPDSSSIDCDLIPCGAAACDYRREGRYFRKGSNGGLQFGAFTSIRDLPSETAFRQIAKQLRQIFPQTATWRLVRVWRGAFSLSRDFLPVCGRKGDHIIWAAGYSGQGLTWSIQIGEMIAEVLLRSAKRFDAVASLPRRKIARSAPFRALFTEFGLKASRLMDAWSSGRCP